MSVVKTEICNLALSHIGVSKNILNFSTERSIEAEQCRLFLPLAFRESLEECRFDEARTFRKLELIETDPTANFRFSYRCPADSIYFIRIFQETDDTYFAKYLNQDTGIRHFDVEWERANVNGETVILTDQEHACAEFLVDELEAARFSTKFIVGLSYKLAFYIAPTIARGQGEKLQPMLEQKYRMKMQEAQALNHNQRNYKDVDDRSQLEIVRRGY
jgi:hypothetical protein